MDVKEVLIQLDNLFASKQFDKVDDFLKTKYEQAVKENDRAAMITILSEQVGYYREATMYDKAVECAEKSLELMQQMGLSETLDYATALINAANAYRAASMYERAGECYAHAERIYDENVAMGKMDKSDFMYAALYNNMSILYQSTGDYKRAEDCLFKALDIVRQYDDAAIELAVTYTNIGAAFIKDERAGEAMEYLNMAREIFERDEVRDYHYGACMTALGEAHYVLGNYSESVNCYETALREIKSTIGTDNETFASVNESYAKAMEKSGENKSGQDAMEKSGENKSGQDAMEKSDENKSGQDATEKSGENKSGQDATDRGKMSVMEICRAYYEKYGKPMIEQKFPEYVDKIAVGLVGEGSECLGFEDDYSKDHDCGPGFCMWTTESVFEKIGDKLNREYEKLPNEFMGLKRNSTEQGRWRRGAMSIDSFYERLLDVGHLPETEEEWRMLEEWRLCTATNGEVFVDKEGMFTKMRLKLLEYYPDELWLKKIANQLAKCAQSGQYNYGRMMARGEYVTARLALSRFVEEVMGLVYLINRKYSPYYKWMHRGIKDIEHLPELYDVLRALADMPDQREAWQNYDYDGRVNTGDNVALTIEVIAGVIVEKLKEQGLSRSSDLFLQKQAEYINENRDDILDLIHKEKSPELKEGLINEIVMLEWQAFDKVQNEGGRADCQDDWTTFSIMRKSQYMTWTEEMLRSFINDFKEADAIGRNLITEKYGRMMESTAPDEYEKIKNAFPALSPQRIKIQEQIIEIQIKWMEEFAEKYKYMADNARSIHTSEDNLYNTSYETYLRGELGTYSDDTLRLYAEFVIDIARKEENLAKLTMENTARLYGFESLEEADGYCR